MHLFFSHLFKDPAIAQLGGLALFSEKRFRPSFLFWLVVVPFGLFPFLPHISEGPTDLPALVLVSNNASFRFLFS